jgi:hypothetical protein
MGVSEMDFAYPSRVLEDGQDVYWQIAPELLHKTNFRELRKSVLFAAYR